MPRADAAAANRTNRSGRFARRGLVAFVFVLILLAAAPVAASAAVLPAASAAPSPTHSQPVRPAPAGEHAGAASKANDLVVLSGDVAVRKDETSGDVVVVHGSVRVAGVVRGDVVVFDGPVAVSGVVHGDLVALDGDVALLAGGHVTGDVTVAQGKLSVQVGSEIDGKVHRGGLSFLSPSKLVTKLAFWIAISVSTLLLGLVLVLLGPRAGDAVALAGRNAVGASIGWGAAMVFGLPVVAVVLLVTLVGLPFGLGLLLALALIYAVGYAYGAWVLGRLFVRPSRHGGSRRLVAFLAGWAVLRAVGFVPVVGGITWFLAAWYGLGAATVATWRARRAPAPQMAAGRTEPGFTGSGAATPAEPSAAPVNAGEAVPSSPAEAGGPAPAIAPTADPPAIPPTAEPPH